MDTLRRHIFLIDGLGAAVSMLGTAYVLPALEAWIGLGAPSLSLLAAPAALFATYSLTCWMLGARPSPWLGPIMSANLGYCAFVWWHLSHHVEAVTPLGWAYFLGETLVIGALLRLEVRVWNGSRTSDVQVAHAT